MKRKSLNGKNLKTMNTPIELVVYTKVPSKWILIDSETGQYYKGTDNKQKFKNWRKITDLELKNILRKL